jgi:hypothetical protein
MSEPTSGEQRETQTWKRRGLFAVAAALVAAFVGRATEQKVEAGVDGDVVLGSTNTTPTPTVIVSEQDAFVARAQSSDLCCRFTRGVQGFGPGFGVYGEHVSGGIVNGSGAAGFAHHPLANGVWGSNDGGGTGVRGDSSGSDQPESKGVLGIASAGAGVYGYIPPESTFSAVGLMAVNDSTYVGPSPGGGGFGCYGYSRHGAGIAGATGSDGGAAVAGSTNGVAGAYAGVFYGPVVVDGDFTVVGGVKSAAVPHPDGSHRRLYCVESPQSWFEDLGKGQLSRGCATVTIDPDFAAVVDLTDYHVFLTGYDDFDLRVNEQSSTGFRVMAKEATSSGRFSWRVVAKRKDIAAQRFERVTVPPEPALPNVPTIAVAPLPPLVAPESR